MTALQTRHVTRGLAVLVVSLILSACAPTTGVTPVLADRSAFVMDYEVAAGVEATFDAVLRVGQEINLNVEDLDRDSGLIRFEPATLSPQQLDTFCFYPYIDPRTGLEWSTFQDWNSRAGGVVYGEVTYTVPVTRAQKGANVNIRAVWVGGTPSENYVCNSRGISEGQFAERVRELVEL